MSTLLRLIGFEAQRAVQIRCYMAHSVSQAYNPLSKPFSIAYNALCPTCVLPHNVCISVCTYVTFSIMIYIVAYCQVSRLPPVPRRRLEGARIRRSDIGNTGGGFSGSPPDVFGAPGKASPTVQRQAAPLRSAGPPPLRDLWADEKLRAAIVKVYNADFVLMGYDRNGADLPRNNVIQRCYSRRLPPFNFA